MRILLNRTHHGSVNTIGDLSINGERLCYTLEDKVREREGQPVARWKVPGRTAIPRGTYKVVVTHSPRFGRPLPLLLNVPGFIGIRIHPGNDSDDTDGCILVGNTWSGGDFIGQSRLAFNAVFSMINAAHQRGEPIEIEVRG